MKREKVNATIRIDKEIWELSKILLPCSRNAFIEKQLIRYINSLDDIEELEREINEDKANLQAKEEKLNDLRQMREFNNKNREIIDKAMRVVFDIIGEHGEVSKTQITYIANNNHISEDVLTSEVKKRNLKISPYTKKTEETRFSTGGLR